MSQFRSSATGPRSQRLPAEPAAAPTRIIRRQRLPVDRKIGAEVLNISQPNVNDIAEVERRLRGGQCFMARERIDTLLEGCMTIKSLGSILALAGEMI